MNRGNENKYGISRAIEPEYVLPTSAWKVDNKEVLYGNEVKIALRKLHIEGTSFRQIVMESKGEDEGIRQKITDIVIRRGKLHNPVSDTGGVLYGVIEGFGENYSNPKKLKVGDEVICNVSLTSIPMHISKIGNIDRVFSQVDAKGYAIAHDMIPIIKKPTGLPVDLLLYVFNESGTIYGVSKEAEGKNKFLVIGTNLLMNLIFGYTIRKIRGKEAEIINLLDTKNNTVMKGEHITKLLKEVFDETHYGNILKPVECVEILGGEEDFEMVINCSELPGAEPLTTLVTAHLGTAAFSNLTNNYNSALYITESISKEIKILPAEGYREEYDDFDIEIVGELSSYFKTKGAIAKGKQDKELTKPTEDRSWQKDLPEEFIVNSPRMGNIIDEVIRVAKYDCNVLITGDTGVGKEKVANIIQKSSTRKMQPFIKVNCAAIYSNLMESEFFGYEPGAFTGASTMGKKGYFELADNGILFLDEVGEIPLDMQAKLLRVIQEGEFYRVGGTKPRKTNLRIISAVNKELELEVEKGTFRRDLYYRLNVVSVKIPALEERKEDIIPLVNGFLKNYGDKFGIKKEIAEDAAVYLENHRWKGNIRELENTVQRLLISSKGNIIELSDVIRGINEEKGIIQGEQREEKQLNLTDMVDDYEKQILKRAFEAHGSTRKAALSLGISQTQFVRKKKKYDF